MRLDKWRLARLDKIIREMSDERMLHDINSRSRAIRQLIDDYAAAR